jgi:hypothetical protein
MSTTAGAFAAPMMLAEIFSPSGDVTLIDWRGTIGVFQRKAACAKHH